MAKPNGNKQALVIVAHPDDETIWMGGFISKHPEFDWTILALCRASDPDRAPKFFRVCEHFNAKGLMEDMDDEGNLTLKASLPIIRQLVLKNVGGRNFEHIFTHGSNGEYGHETHLFVHKAIKGMLGKKELSAKGVYFFNYKKSNRPGELMTAKSDSDQLLHLTKSEFAKKKKVMSKLYGFNPDGIDAGYCTNPEGFKVKNFQ